MKKSGIYFLALTILLVSCTQKDFVVRKVVAEGRNGYLFYDVYKTGLDNYTFSFSNAYDEDTVKLFDHVLNDAVYTAFRFNKVIAGDTIYLSTNMAANNEVHKLGGAMILKFGGLK